ncbi:MAG: hypothetical protein KF832_05350 [Caldilineaceae bacterium]|nr:hypothetical protein [Caldilineaceae bacterium]
MAKKSAKLSKPQTRTLDLRTFTSEFFTHLGATVKTVDRRKTGALQVDLPTELATYFGQPTLTLYFQQPTSELLPTGQQLVAHGSPLFDKMLAYLDNRSAVTHQRLPVRHQAGEELMRAVRPINTGIVGLRLSEQTQHLYAFHWHITYRADDKHEELYSVLLNEAGERMDLPAAATDPDAPSALTQLLADAEAFPSESAAEGTLGNTSGRLPPMTHLGRLAEIARKYAIYHADVRCVSHEAEILPRLYKTLNRLITYYQQQIEEVYDAHDPTGEKRRALESDLERKLAEEVENHRLRVGVQLFSYAVLQVPIAAADLTLSDGKREVAVQVMRNRYDGTLQRPRCSVCHQEMTQVVLDRNGHLICDRCLHQCGTCQELLCTTCGVAPCPVCQQQNCDTCGRLCWACGERACAEHNSPCPVCKDEVCHACQELCSHCGVRQCRSHLRLDQVKVQAGETAYICEACALRCPGCAQYSAEIGRCSASGQRFCQNCLVSCTACQRTVGVGFYERIDQAPYCHRCLVECPSCQQWALATTLQPCAVPSTPLAIAHNYCPQCGAMCDLCGRDYCAEHSQRYATCEHVVCNSHAAHCLHCAESLCPLCHTVCAICERYHCEQHTVTCSQCSQAYCQRCVGKSGLCVTCQTLASDGIAVDLTQEACFADPSVANLAPYYTWQRAHNLRYILYRGQAEQRRPALIVVAEAEDQVVFIEGQGARAGSATATTEAPQVKDAHEWLHEFQEWLRRIRRNSRGR